MTRKQRSKLKHSQRNLKKWIRKFDGFEEITTDYYIKKWTEDIEKLTKAWLRHE
jgi:hypothetical protein